MSAQRAVLRGTVAVGMLFAQQGKQRGRLQRGVAFELFDHPGPIFLKGIVPGWPIMGTLTSLMLMYG